uniref:Uncharacterized protein n=1 Tax=Micrurus surinamensis TaxID=129470 RepID=A0A2D4PFN4_MICSU
MVLYCCWKLEDRIAQSASLDFLCACVWVCEQQLVYVRVYICVSVHLCGILWSCVSFQMSVIIWEGGWWFGKNKSSSGMNKCAVTFLFLDSKAFFFLNLK